MIIKSEKDEIAQYLIDESGFKGDCEKVYLPESRQDVIDILVLANKLKTPVTIAGNHTSLTGSSVPQKGWVISTERLSRIIDLNAGEQTITVEPGVTLKEMQELLQQNGLFFPPDPTETSCTVGGMVGTNASGARSFKYGAVKNFVEEIEIVTANGSLVNITRGSSIFDSHFNMFINENDNISFEIPSSYSLPNIKNNVGYNLKTDGEKLDLFIGAEGTLGFITAIKFNVLHLPYAIISFVAFINDIDLAFSYLHDLRNTSKANAESVKQKLSARLIEFFDENSLNMLRAKFPDIPLDAKAAFWVEQEVYDEQHYSDALLSWEEFHESKKVNLDDIWFGMDEADKAKIVNFRHSLPILVNDFVRSRGYKKLGTDIAVPDDSFESYYKWVIATVKDQHIDYVIFGHFGDSHIHLNLLPASEHDMARGKDLYHYICSEAIMYKGTFSAEHGTGKTKKTYLEKMYKPDDINFMKEVKLMFDPNNILSPGNLF